MTDALWLPAAALKPLQLREVPKGALVLRRPYGGSKAPSYGIRFDGDDRRWLFSLSDSGEWTRFARAEEVTNSDEIAFHIDLPFAIEFNGISEQSEWGYLDCPPGDLVLGEDGPSLLARWSIPAGPVVTRPVSISAWEWTTEQRLKAVLGSWRVSISLSTTQSAWLSPPHRSAKKL